MLSQTLILLHWFAPAMTSFNSKVLYHQTCSQARKWESRRLMYPPPALCPICAPKMLCTGYEHHCAPPYIVLANWELPCHVTVVYITNTMFYGSECQYFVENLTVTKEVNKCLGFQHFQHIHFHKLSFWYDKCCLLPLLIFFPKP